MLVGGRSSRRTMLSLSGAELEDKAEKGGGFFQRKLARFLRRSSVASTTLVSGGALLGAAARPSAAGVSVIEPEIVFAAARRHGVATTAGARPANEDRYRIITNLDLYGAAFLDLERQAHSLSDALAMRLLESYVVRNAAPAFRASSLLRHEGSTDTQLFGIYDGHGGARCSSLLALLLPLYLLDAPQFREDLAAASATASLAINAEIRAREAQGQCDGGSTAVTLLLRGRTATLANTGDCRAILLSRPDGTPAVTQLTTDHKATDERERRRIENAGGLVLFVKGVARVNGRLAVARAFGDSDLSSLVIPDPEVVTRELQPHDEFIVLASDGLWDVMTNEQVASCVRCVALMLYQLVHVLWTND